MSLDRLLVWASARREGSLPQFRAAVEELHMQQDGVGTGVDDAADGAASSDLPVYQLARLALQQLGHVEFSCYGVESGWRVVPPSIALFAEDCTSGVLCGARSPALIEALRSASGIEVVAGDFSGMPARIVLHGSSPDHVRCCADSTGLLVQPAASTAMLSTLPQVSHQATWHPSQLPETPGWSVERFSPPRQGWQQSDERQAMVAPCGLFRFQMKHQRFYYLRYGGRTHQVPVQVGKYVVTRIRRGILRYDSDTRVLTVPPIYRPPLLIERALILCSGKLPGFDGRARRLEYAHVPPLVARLASQLLRQEIS